MKHQTKSSGPATQTKDELLSPQQAGKFLNLHPITLRRYRRDGVLRALRLPGGGIRYRRDDLLKLLELTNA